MIAGLVLLLCILAGILCADGLLYWFTCRLKDLINKHDPFNHLSTIRLFINFIDSCSVWIVWLAGIPFIFILVMVLNSITN